MGAYTGNAVVCCADGKAGNTLDATPTEGSWNNPPVVPKTFDTIKASGYKGVRLPGRSPVGVPIC